MNRSVVIFEGYTGTVGGSHRMALEVARAGVADGRWQTVVMLPEAGTAADWLRSASVDVEIAGSGPMPSGGSLPRQALRAALQLPRLWVSLSRRFRAADLIHIHDIRGLVMAGPAAVLARRTWLWHVHSASRARLAHRLLARLLLARGITVVVPSRRGAAWAGALAPRLAELPNTCATGTLSTEADQPLVVTVGRRHPDKGLDVLLDALPVVRSRVPGTRLRLIAPVEPGQPVYDAMLRGRAQEDGVELLGAVPDLQAARAGAWVYCQPSRFEPFGLAALEASAAGVPVVATRVGGLPDVVVDEVTGLLVDPTAEALSAALIQLLLDPQRRAALGAAGAERVSNVFSRAEFARRIAGLYALPAPSAVLQGSS